MEALHISKWLALKICLPWQQECAHGIVRVIQEQNEVN